LSLELHPEKADVLILRRENDVVVRKIVLMVRNQIALEVDDPPQVSEYDISPIELDRFYVMAVAVTPSGSTGTVLIRLKRGDGKSDAVVQATPPTPEGCSVGNSGSSVLPGALLLLLGLLWAKGQSLRRRVTRIRRA
jgi:hypothetical protein